MPVAAGHGHHPVLGIRDSLFPGMAMGTDPQNYHAFVRLQRLWRFLGIQVASKPSRESGGTFHDLDVIRRHNLLVHLDHHLERVEQRVGA